MKQKTVMMKLIDKLMRMPDSHIKNYLALVQDDLIKLEKIQIIDAFDTACQDQDRIGMEYYNETYKQD